MGPQWSRPVSGAEGRRHHGVGGAGSDAAMEPPRLRGGGSSVGTWRTAVDALAAMEPPRLRGGGSQSADRRLLAGRSAAMEPPRLRGGGSPDVALLMSFIAASPQWSRPVSGAEGPPGRWISRAADRAAMEPPRLRGGGGSHEIGTVNSSFADPCERWHHHFREGAREGCQGARSSALTCLRALTGVGRWTEPLASSDDDGTAGGHR